MDKIKLAQRTIALLSSMIESGECHTARTKEMKTNALNGLNEVNNLLISGVSQQRELLIGALEEYNNVKYEWNKLTYEDYVNEYHPNL
jgi:hypothetical protein